MTALEILNQKINVLKDTLSQLSDSDIDERTKLQAQMAIIDECERIIDNEDLMSNYDFSNAIKLIEAYNYSIDDLSQIISDIQSVLLVRKELNISDSDMPLDDKQISTFKTFVEGLRKIKEELDNKIKQSSENIGGKEKINNLEALKNILEGTGRRKYYTEDMFRDFYEEFDILSLSPDDAWNLLEGFYQTRNLSSRQTKEKANFDDVISLYKEFLSTNYFKMFELLLKKHEEEVTSVIDFDNARDILQFFKEKGILENFERAALLKISLYGRSDYVKEIAYPDIISNKSDDIETFYQTYLASVWIKEKGTSVHRSSPFRRSRGQGEQTKKEHLITNCHTVDINEFWENIEILRANSALFNEKYNIGDVNANLSLSTLPVWMLKKNIELCKLFGLGVISPITPTCIDKGDVEDKINLAVELGLLNPPLTQKFIEIDKGIVRNEEFQKNTSKKGIYNQSIRNYFPRYSSVLSTESINEYAYLFYKLQNEGYTAFYNDFFSDVHAGKGNPEMITPQVREVITDKKKMDDFITENFMTEWYSDFIQGYDEYDDVIIDYTDFEKQGGYRDWNYIDSGIYNDELIKELEEKNTVMDVINHNNEIEERKNEFVYMFGDRIISRYKVLHNASILKKTYGVLTEDMLLTSIVRNSFLDKDTFDRIYKDVKGRGKTL